MRRALTLLFTYLPSGLKRRVGRVLFGWDIHPTAHIGRSVIRVRHLTMGPGSGIGPRNVIRDLEELRLGEGARIGGRNNVAGWPLGTGAFPHSPDRRPALILGDYAHITTGHEIDCCDRVELFDHATIAGYNVTVLTHNVDLVRDHFITAPVELGERSGVMSGCTLLSGTRVPAYSIVSAGSVVTTPLTDEYTLYRGNPAEPIRKLPKTLKIFSRPGGIDSAEPS